MRPSRLRLVPLLLLLACASQKQEVKASCPEGAAHPEASVQPLSAQAAATFGYLGSLDSGSSLVVDLDQMEQLGFSGPMSFVRSVPRSLMTLLPLAGSVPEEEAGMASGPAPDYSRYLVALAALDQWADLPAFRRMGVWVPRTPQGIVGGLPGAVIVFATDKGKVPTHELFQGLAAIARVLSDQGRAPVLVARGEALCAGDPSIGVPLCLSAAEGLLMLSMEGAPDRLFAMMKSGKPSAAPSTDVISAHLELGPEGTVNLRAYGSSPTTLHAELVSQVPELVEEGYARVNDLVAKWDASQKEREAKLSEAIGRFNQKLAQDKGAPESLKAAASQLSPDSLRDKDADLQAVRQSLKVTKGANSVTAEVQIPGAAVRRLATTLSPSNPMFTLGALAAIAVPNFEKFQCRSKQSEARANLKALYIAQRSFFAEKDRIGKSFEEIGFAPDEGTRYSYCMASGCLACTHKECKPEQGMGPCQGLVRAPSGKKQAKDFVFQGCAYGNLDGDPGMDVWTIAEDGVPVNVTPDCGQ